MKHLLTRTLAIILILCTLVSPLTLVGCSDIQTDYAIRYKDTELSKAIFLYLCSTEKTTYLYEAYGLDSSTVSSSQLQDNSAIWTATDASGLTVGNMLKMDVLQKAQLQLYMAQYAKDQGYILSAEQKKSIENDFRSMLTVYETKKEFNKQMKQYGVDYDQILQYYYLQAFANTGKELLFGENGTMKITDEAAKSFFNKNYITIGAIFINTKNKVYPNGKVVVLPAEEKAQKLALADDIMAKLNAGEDFTGLCQDHCDMTEDENAEKGYTFLKGGFKESAVEEKAFTLTEGEFCRIDVDGGVYIIQKKALNTEYYQNAKESIRQTLEKMRQLTLIADEQNNYKTAEDFINEIDIVTLPHMV